MALKEKAARVYGVLTEHIDEEAVTAALESLDLPTEGTVEERVGRLVAHFREATPADRLAKCDVCEGKSDAALETCPFCGTGDDDDDDAGDDDDAEDGIEDETEDETEDVEVPPEPLKAEPKASKAEPKGKGVKAKKVKAELAVVDVDPRFSIKDLDAAVERANQLTRAGAVVAFELGLQLKQIHTDQLWKLRKGEDGTPVYKSFEAFVMAELEISRQTAYEQIDVSANYDKADVERLGYKKLALLLKAPEGKRAELKSHAEKGASYRELAAEVKNARVGAGGGKRDTGRKTTPEGKANASGRGGKNAETQTITIAALLGKQSVPMYKSLKKTGSKELVPATSLDDDPWAYVELKNGVVEVFHIAKTAKGLVLQIKRERRNK